MPIMKNENIGELEPAIAIDGHGREKFRRETKSLSGIFQHSLDIPLRLKNYDEHFPELGNSLPQVRHIF